MMSNRIEQAEQLIHEAIGLLLDDGFRMIDVSERMNDCLADYEFDENGRPVES